MSEFKGQKDLLRALRQFPLNIQKNAMTGTIRAAAKPIVKAVKDNAPVKKGILKKSIGVVKRKTKNRATVRFSVTARKGGKYNGWYAHFPEFGTSKMAAKPFFRPAYENQSNQSIEAAKTYLSKRIDKEVSKARR